MRQQLANLIRQLIRRIKLVEYFNKTSKLGRPAVVVAHHGTTWDRAREIRRLVNSGSVDPFHLSYSDGEWLGNGVYFWLMAPHRAATWGEEIYSYRRKRLKWLPNLSDPAQTDYLPLPAGQQSHFAVVEVRLRLFPNTTVNLLDQLWVDRIQAFYSEFEARVRNSENAARARSNYSFVDEVVNGVKTRVIKDDPGGPFRTRDCMFFNELVERHPEVQSIVASFSEGEHLLPGMSFGVKDHVQACVFDQSIIELDGMRITDAADILDRQ